jgi:large subunit ribosomal protein L10
MPTAEKERTIEQAQEWYSRSKGVVFTDYRGLKVKEMQELRRNLKAKGAEIHVLKNTLFRIAAGEDAASLPDDLHNGPTAIAFLFESESEGAKAIFDYAQTNKNLKIKGGFVGGRAMDAKGVEALSKLPPRDVLIAQVIGAIAAPLSNLVGIVEALYADPIRVIGAVADKVGEGGGAEPEPKGETGDISEEGAVSTDATASAAPAADENATTEAPDEGALPAQGDTATGQSEETPDTTSTEAAEASTDTEATTENQ